MLDRFFGKRTFWLHARTTSRGSCGGNCENPGNAGQRAAVISHRMNHTLLASDAANR
jgi:hypothetical protein